MYKWDKLFKVNQFLKLLQRFLFRVIINRIKMKINMFKFNNKVIYRIINSKVLKYNMLKFTNRAFIRIINSKKFNINIKMRTMDFLILIKKYNKLY